MSTDTNTGTKYGHATFSVVTRLVLLVATLALAACWGGEQATDASAPTTEDTTVRPPPSEDPLVVLSEREGPRRETTGSVPHQQLGAEPVPEVDAELRRRAFLLPGVADQASALSLPGARGLVLEDGVEIVQPEVLGGGREFAHIHPDGSLHVWLPVERAQEVHRAKWGELHPWTTREGFWDGVVMVFTPESLEELDVTIRLLVDAYNFMTGASLNPEDLS